MIKYHAQFLLDKEKGNPTAKLRYRIKWEGIIVAFSVGYRIEIDKWSRDTQRCKINTTHGKKKVSASAINRKIQEYEQACEKVFLRFNGENKTPTADEFRVEFNREIGKKIESGKEMTLFEIYDQFTEDEGKKNQWTKSTYEKMETQKKHLFHFDQNLSFSDITEEKLIDYQYFLQDSINLKNSTILKQFSFLRWFLRWCRKKKYIQTNAFEDFKPKLKTTQKKIIFLTQSEIQQVKKYSIPPSKEYLERVRDVFLFLCFTGLRYSDVCNLKKTDIKDNTIEITTIKTTDSLIIELNNHSKEILDKYKDKTFDGDLALPTISNQKMNEYLKELMELAGIDEPIRETYYKGNRRIDTITPKYALIGTHAGRRTFICNALSLGIPPQVVMKWTGHSDYKSMKPYVDIADETKASAMERFNLL
ncbi:site-specific integrase [Riemerella anatipestifer]|uniref:site-specific integrase n=1 Tax=Riemerella anatipestifer TaxID=34085 RepID=UPI00285F7D52|nr:site-specific integrase [Riemerella anatipestifer]MDR7694140.1 site-specific integrase [Riemerella anatipestifer]